MNDIFKFNLNKEKMLEHPRLKCMASPHEVLLQMEKILKEKRTGVKIFAGLRRNLGLSPRTNIACGTSSLSLNLLVEGVDVSNGSMGVVKDKGWGRRGWRDFSPQSRPSL